jgi:hypothetical protein
VGGDGIDVDSCRIVVVAEADDVVQQFLCHLFDGIVVLPGVFSSARGPKEEPATA